MNKPKIRFEGFTEAWEQRKLGKLVTIERGGSPRPIDSFITKDENGLNWVKIGDAPEQGNYITHTTEKIKPEGLSKTREVHPGDLILSNSMSFGRPYIMAIDGCIHDGWLAIRDNEKRFDLRFLCTMLGTDSMLNQYKAMAAGSTVNNLNKELVGGTTVSFPTMSEQNKIGDYFFNLDHLITLHQHKCEQTKKLKKYMLQKMFPQNGNKYPEIRFKGFTEAWEQRKLGEMGSTFTGLSGKTKEDFGHGDAKFITYMNVFSNPIADLSMTEAVEIDKRQNEVKKGDVFFTTSSETPEEVGMSCVMPENVDNIYLNSFCFGYRPIEKFDLNYLAYVLRADAFRKDMSFLAQGISRYNISKNKVMEVTIPIPVLEEQSLVGKYFSNLDHLITLHQHKCNELQKIKKFMLQNMFV